MLNAKFFEIFDEDALVFLFFDGTTISMRILSIYFLNKE